MTKKSLLIILPLILLTGIFFFPFKKTSTIEIKFSFVATLNLLKPENWDKWQPDLAAEKAKHGVIKISSSPTHFVIKTNDITIDAITEDGFKYKVRKSAGKSSVEYEYVILPQKIAGRSVIVTDTYSNLFRAITKQQNQKTDIEYLKTYTQNPKKYYGFDIYRGNVVDSNIVLKRKIIAIKDKELILPALQSSLNKYINQHHLSSSQKLMVSIKTIGQDSIRVMMGIPIKETVITNKDFIFMQQPAKGHMLFVSFKGKYGDRRKLYQSMRSYFTDHDLASPEDPYEKFLDSKMPLNDSSQVNMQVCYPIF